MLVEFTVSNFRSFYEETTLSMAAGTLKSKNPFLDAEATFEPAPGTRLLKVAALYGANGSGKSNLFEALRQMKNFVERSATISDPDEEIDRKPCLLRKGADKEPSKFRVLFVSDGALFEYGYRVTAKQITEEWLLRKKLDGKRTTELFTRKGNTIHVHKLFSEGIGLSEKTRPNALFLSVCAQFNGRISAQVIRWFKSLRVVSGLSDRAFLSATAKALNDETRAEVVKRFIATFDLGFTEIQATADRRLGDIDVKAVPPELSGLALELKKLNSIRDTERYRILTNHPVFDKKGKRSGEASLDLETDESEGTKKLVAFAGPLVDSLTRQFVLVIDEFDARLHPLITRQILKLFNGASNPMNAQLIVATHDTNLLDNELLRRDQIWFVEKDARGESHLASLVEYRVRNDASYEKDYVMGKYGAIPFLGSVERVFVSETDLEVPTTAEE